MVKSVYNVLQVNIIVQNVLNHLDKVVVMNLLMMNDDQMRYRMIHKPLHQYQYLLNVLNIFQPKKKNTHKSHYYQKKNVEFFC